MESDGIEEAIEGQFRVLVTAAGRLGERIARARERAQREAQAASEREAREFSSRIEAEKKVAQLELSRVHQTQWWDAARPDDVAHAYRLAKAWEPEDLEAARAAQRIRDELGTRYGIDTENPGVSADGVGRALREWADQGWEKAKQEAEASQLMTLADREEAEAEAARAAAEYEPDVGNRVHAAAAAERHEARAEDARETQKDAYDSAERRQATAGELAATGLGPELVETRMIADVSQGRPATEAVKQTSKRTAPKARRRRTAGRAVQAERGNVSR